MAEIGQARGSKPVDRFVIDKDSKYFVNEKGERVIPVKKGKSIVIPLSTYEERKTPTGLPVTKVYVTDKNGDGIVNSGDEFVPIGTDANKNEYMSSDRVSPKDAMEMICRGTTPHDTSFTESSEAKKIRKSYGVNIGYNPKKEGGPRYEVLRGFKEKGKFIPSSGSSDAVRGVCHDHFGKAQISVPAGAKKGEVEVTYREVHKPKELQRVRLDYSTGKLSPVPKKK